MEIKFYPSHDIKNLLKYHDINRKCCNDLIIIIELLN